MKLFYKFVFCLFFSILMIACSKEESSIDGTVVVGKFRVTGSAESGPYALKLFKIDRYIANEFEQMSDWKVVESERKQELLSERGDVPQKSSGINEFLDKGLTTLQKKLFKSDGAGGNAQVAVNEQEISEYPAADYILVGQMDGFDFDINRGSQIKTRADGQEIVQTLTGRVYKIESTLSIRLISTKDRRVVVSKTINYQDFVSSQGNMESKINDILRNMSSRIVAETLLSLSGDIQVAAVNQDGSLLLNKGLQSGLKKGMKLDLKRLGEWVKDPATGENLARSSHKIGAIEIISVQLKTAIAKYSGVVTDEMPRVEDMAVFDNSTFEAEERFSQPIRVAVGSVTMTDPNILKGLSAQALRSLVVEIEEGLANKLNGKLGIKIADQHSQRIKDMLAQQMLTDLNQGKEPGLPMGTIQGVDYLVFMSIVRNELKLPGRQIKNFYGVNVETIKGGDGFLKAYVFLQDVNSSNTAARTEIRVTKKFSKEISLSKAWSEMIDSLLTSVNKQILTQLRPLEVLSASNNLVVLNHGKDVLNIGDKLQVFSKGETRIDDYTGNRMQNVGSQQVAEIEVSGFQPPDYTTATLVSGELPEAGMAVAFNENSGCTKEQNNCLETNSDDGVSVNDKQEKAVEYNW